MEIRTMPAAAAALAGNLPRLTKLVVEQLQDPAMVGDPTLERSIELVLDRFCLSLQLSKPVGLNSWAAGEARRLGAARTSELASAAAHVIASEAAHFALDHDRLLAFIEALKSEVYVALTACDAGDPEAKSVYSESTRAVLAMLGERDAATCCHSKATGEWARRLCAAMGLSSEMTAFIELCAVLHDLGKISTPDRILFKPGPLSASEWEIMRDHAAAGQRILDQIPSLARCSLIVRAHHERWDGTGYPDGLAGENMPFEARVLAVADAFHAMISDRPYRKAIPPRQALEILRAGRGTQWDAHVVDAMLNLVQGRRTQPRATQASTA